MSKAKVSWAFQERPVSSTKMNQVVKDYITPALPIWSFANDAFWDDDLSSVPLVPAAQSAGINYGWWPYNPQKSVYDRLYLLAQATTNNADVIANVEVSFNGGVSWTAAFPSLVNGPVDFGNPAFSYVETWNLDVQVATFQWIGIRDTANTFFTTYHFRLLGLLYRSTDTPF